VNSELHTFSAKETASTEDERKNARIPTNIECSGFVHRQGVFKRNVVSWSPFVPGARKYSIRGEHNTFREVEELGWLMSTDRKGAVFERQRALVQHSLSLFHRGLQLLCYIGR
jgi:hypothetical protein